MSERKPAEVFHIGEFIRDELRARDWSIGDCARAMGGDWRRNYFCIEFLTSVQEPRVFVSQELADQLEKAFGVSAQTWLNLDEAWRKYAVLEGEDGDQ